MEIPSNLKDKGPEWAMGCDGCSFGIVLAPPLTGALPLNLERLGQMLEGSLVFCECQAGVRYKVYLMNLEESRKDEAKKHPMMKDFANRDTHPDIESARRYSVQENEVPMPTFHYDGSAVRGPKDD